MKGTTRTIVEFFDDEIKFFLGDCGEIGALGEVPPQFPVHKLVEATIAGAVGPGAVDDDLQLRGDLFMLRNLMAVVMGHREAVVLGDSTECRMTRPYHLLCGLIGNENAPEIHRKAFREGGDGSRSAPRAHYEIALPIATSLLPFHNLRPFFDASAIGHLPFSALPEAMPLVLLALVRQMEMHAAAFLFVLPDVVVDGLMAHCVGSVPRRKPPHTSGDLVGTLPVTKLLHNMLQHRGFIVPTTTMVVGSLPSLLRTFMRLVGLVPEARVGISPGQFPADRGLVAADEVGNFRLRLAGTDKNFDLVPLGSGKMSHTVEGVEVERRPFYRTYREKSSGEGSPLRSEPSPGMHFRLEFAKAAIDNL